MYNLKKKDLASAIAKEHDLTKKQADEIINQVFDEIKDCITTGGTVEIAGFGKFSLQERAARTCINPQTKEKIEVPASKAVKFTVAKAFKDAAKEA